MTDVLYDFISTGVDLVLVAAVIAIMLTMLRGSARLTNVIAEQQVTTAEFDRYLQLHKYDNQNNLAFADALSAIVGYRYDMRVFIKASGNKYFTNDPETGRFYIITATGGTVEGKLISDLMETAQEVKYDKECEGRQSIVNSGLDSQLYHATLLDFNKDGTLLAQNFNRDSVFVGILFTY